MTFLEFIINGGLCGLMSGFNNTKEGHAFNFKDVKQTFDDASNCIGKIGQLLHGFMQLLK